MTQTTVVVLGEVPAQAVLVLQALLQALARHRVARAVPAVVRLPVVVRHVRKKADHMSSMKQELVVKKWQVVVLQMRTVLPQNACQIVLVKKALVARMKAKAV